MSIIEQAEREMRLAKFSAEDTAVMLKILRLFFDHFDSGGSVYAVAPVLQRLIAGKPISPLTGDADEWVDHGHHVFQNRRCGTVFKEKDVNGNWIAYDIDRKPNGDVSLHAMRRHRWAPCEVTFPYWPDKAEVGDPVMVIDTERK